MKEHGFLFAAPLVRALLDGRKTQTRRLITPRNSLINGYSTARSSPAWSELDFDDVFVDPGPSPAGNAGPYLKVACEVGSHAGSRHRIYPRVQVGDLIWGRETWQFSGWTEDGQPWVRYAADEAKRLCERIPDEWSDRLTDTWADLSAPENLAIDGFAADRVWRPSIFLPRWASRIVLEVVGVKPERVASISEADARAEGVDGPHVGRWTDANGATTPPLDQPARPWAHSFAVAWKSINEDRASWFADPWVWAYEFRAVPRC